MTAFSLQCVIGSTIGYALLESRVELLIEGFRMILFKLPIVVPTRTLWLIMLVLIGIFGFFAQVCHPVSIRLFLRPDRLFQPIKILLNMGLQRETASRGSLAIYTSVCLP